MDLYKIFLPVLLLLAACQQQPEPVVTEIENATSMTADETPEFLNSAAYEQLNLPFSEAVRVGNLLYMSGQIGIKPGVVELVPGGTAAETRQTLENIKTTVERYGSSMDRVFKCTVFMADNAERTEINEVYRSFFPANPPARSGVGVNGLALGARVEIECIASLPGDWKVNSEKMRTGGSRRPFL